MQSRKKINILILFSSSDIGGAERSLSRMAIFNEDKTISYQLSTYSNSGSWSKWVSNKKRNPICFNHSFWKLTKYIYKFKPDCIYVIGFRLSVLLRLTKFLFPRLYLVQGVRWNPSSNIALDKIFRAFERFFGFLIDGYIVNSDSAKKTLKKFINNDVKLIYNGIAYSQRSAVKKTTKKNIITIANLSKRKGHQEYLNAISIVIKSVPECQFLFLGKDNLNGDIQELIINNQLASNVKYLGFQEKIDHILKDCVMFVLPSLYGEGCPTSILEAFSFSLPVVAYNIDGIPELVRHNVDGLLYESGNTNDLALGIISLLRDPEKSKEMGIAGRKKVNDHFLMEDMVKNHNKFFTGLI